MPADHEEDDVALLRDRLTGKTQIAEDFDQPQIVLSLAAKGRSTVAADPNVLRAPLWEPVRHGVAGVRSQPSTILWNHSFRTSSSEEMPNYRDLMLLVHLTTTWVSNGCSKDRIVVTSLGDAAKAMGLALPGGSQRRTSRSALRRMRAIVIESAIREHRDLAVVGWGLIDAYWIDASGVAVRVSQEYASLVTSGRVTFLHEPTMRALAHVDLVAMRLWAFLETETLPREFRYRLFGAPHELPRDHQYPPIATLLRLTDKKRSRIVARLQAALAAIQTCDHSYRLRLESSASGEDRNLVVAKSRSRRAEASTPVPASTNPERPIDSPRPGQVAPQPGANGAPAPGQMAPQPRANDGPEYPRDEPHRRSDVGSTDVSTVHGPDGSVTSGGVSFDDRMRDAGLPEDW